MKAKPVPTFRVHGDELDGVVTVSFVRLPRDAAPGYSHRVLVKGKAVDWLHNDSKPNANTACYFAKKHGGQS